MGEARALEALRQILARPEFLPRSGGTVWDVVWGMLLALWELYLAALYALEERHVLPVQEARTNREHAERLAHDRPKR